MRAAWYERLGPAAQVLQVGKMDIPAPSSGQVLVRLYASGVNPADVKIRSGWIKVREIAGPTIPNCDGAGIIEAVGKDVPKSRVGQRVWVHVDKANPRGTAAEYIAVDTDDAHFLPDGIGFAEGACIGVPVVSAHHAVLFDGPVDGQTILVAGGAGVVGHYAIQVATRGGATVIATVSSPAKAEHAKAAGAGHIIDYKNEDVAARVMEITGGKGVDRIVEVDFGANLQIDAAIIKPGGIIASYSSSSQPEPVLPYYALALKGVTVHFVQATIMPLAKKRRMYDDVAGWLASGALTHTIGKRFTLDQVAAAHEAVETGSVMGKVVIEIS